MAPPLTLTEIHALADSATIHPDVILWTLPGLGLEEEDVLSVLRTATALRGNVVTGVDRGNVTLHLSFAGDRNGIDVIGAGR